MVRLPLLLSVLLSLMLVVACSKKEPVREVAALPVVTDASADLLLTWIDDKGEFHVEQKVADVPVTQRDVVRVADPVKDPPKLDDVFVADLRNARADGTYPVRTMSRPEFEKIATDRRQAHGKGGGLAARPAAPPPAPGSSAALGTADKVIIYGASWCGPCHQAAKYFTSHNVPFVEKDIEADSSAAREMHAKLAKAGMRGGSIPVIDVRGKLLVGFDQRAIERALGQTL